MDVSIRAETFGDPDDRHQARRGSRSAHSPVLPHLRSVSTAVALTIRLPSLYISSCLPLDELDSCHDKSQQSNVPICLCKHPQPLPPHAHATLTLSTGQVINIATMPTQ